MKFSYVFFGLLVILFNMNLTAGFQGPSSSDSAVDPDASWAPKSQQINTVDKVKYAEDGENIILTGHIVKKLSPQVYVFTDPTGTINVEISTGAWDNIEIEPTTLVRIYGNPGSGYLNSNVTLKIYKVEAVKTK